MKKQTILIHTLVSVMIAGLLYFYQPLFAKSFLIASFVFNLYLQLLYTGFEAPLRALQAETARKEPADDDKADEGIKINPWALLLSVFRVVLTAAILAILIMKFKLNLMATGMAFLLYQLILIAIGFYFNASHQRTNTR